MSVPSTSILVRVTGLLSMSIDRLLKVRRDVRDGKGLTRRLTRLGRRLTEGGRGRGLLCRTGRGENLVLFISFLSVVVAVDIGGRIMSVLVTKVYVLVTTVMLCHGLTLFADLAASSLEVNVFHIAALYGVDVLVVNVIFTFLDTISIVAFSRGKRGLFTVMLLSYVVIFVNVMSPGLPCGERANLHLP